MPDRCAAPTRRPEPFSHASTVCEPSPEELAAASIEQQREAEREAELRRNQYFESGCDEGGRSARASSDASRYSPMLPDDPHLKDARRTAAIDRPLQDDRLGNAIAAGIAGGIIKGVGTAAAQALAPSAGVQPVVKHIAVEVGKGVVKAVAKNAVGSTLEPGPDLAPVPQPSASSTAAGRTGPRGTSEVVDEPNQSSVPRYSPLVIQG